MSSTSPGRGPAGQLATRLVRSRDGAVVETLLRSLNAAQWRLVRGVERANVWAERSIFERAGRAEVDRFADVERFCLFVGFPRSGGTLVGAALDAHPDMLIAHEMGSLRKVGERGYSRLALCAAALRSDRLFASRGWGNQDDVFEIPGQWQGRVRRLRVLGDKHADPSTLRLIDDPSLLDRLGSTLGVPVRVIVIVRNPFDNIARMALRGSMTVLAATSLYAALAAGVQDVIDREGDDVLVQYHEDTVADPQSAFRRLADFLQVEAAEDWVDACASLVFPSARMARTSVAWTPAETALVEEMIERYPFLERYRSDGPGDLPAAVEVRELR